MIEENNSLEAGDSEIINEDNFFEQKREKDVKELLEVRERIDNNRPNFVRGESWRYKRLQTGWRKPRGIDNKMRRRIKGWPKTVNVGYRGPKITRGLHPSGYRDVLVHNMKELGGLDPEKDAARFASSVGSKKRAELLKKAKELNIKVLNPKGIRKIKKETQE